MTTGLAAASAIAAGLVAVGPAVVAWRSTAWLVLLAVAGVTLLVIPEPAWSYGIAETWRYAGISAQPQSAMAVTRGVMTVALQLWCIPAATTAFALCRLSADVLDAARLDGVLARTVARSVLPAWVGGCGVVAMLTLRMTTPFDLGGFKTSGVAARLAFGETPGSLGDKTAAALGMSLPTALVVVGIIVMLVWGLSRSSIATSADQPRRPASRAAAGVTAMVLLCTAVPMLALLKTAGVPAFAEYVPELLAGLALGGIVAAATALVAMPALVVRPGAALLVAVAVFVCGGQVLALSLIRLIAAKPDVAWLVALQDVAYDTIYDRPVFHAWPAAAMFAFLPLAAAAWTWRGGLATLREVAAVDGAGRLATARQVIWPNVWAMMLASLVAVAALAMAEPNAAALTYPGSLVNTMLANVHTLAYGPMARAALLSAGVAAGLAIVIVAMLRLGRLVPVVLVACLLVGCDGGDEPEAVFGTLGTGDGQIVYPRAIAFSEADDAVWVIDRTARVQKLDAATGEFVLGFDMPDNAFGRPVGVSVDRVGRVWVPDTHYGRVIVFSSTGDELFRIGRSGQGPGEFVWPTDVLVLTPDRVLVAEYGAGEAGNNDRIQLLERQPDGRWEGTASIGSFGTGPGEFRRPQSMVLIDQTLWVTDATNHRLIAFDTRPGTFGDVIRVIGDGGASAAVGRFRFPYGLCVDGQGMLIVTEFGNNRLQRIDPTTGEGLGFWGDFGARPGEFRYPWAVTYDPKRDRLLVADGGNDRVQVVSADAFQLRASQESSDRLATGGRSVDDPSE